MSYQRVFAATGILLALTAPAPLFGQVSLAERDALVRLFNENDGLNWNNPRGWLGPPGTECDWNGVTCDCGLGQPVCSVTGLNLLGPSGPLSTAVFELTNLTNLSIASRVFPVPSLGGQLTGELPAEIGQLTNLEVLSLKGHRFSGGVPESFANLTRLRSLRLERNDLSGPLPETVSRLENLSGIDLDNNRFSGPLPVSWSNLPELGHISLCCNQLSGSIPPEYGNLPLTYLSLSHNRLSGPIPAQLGGGELGWLLLRDIQLSGDLPAELGISGELEILSLADNQLTGNIPAEFGNLLKLRTLTLDNNPMSGRIPDEIYLLPELFKGTFTGTGLEGPNIFDNPGETSFFPQFVAGLDGDIRFQSFLQCANTGANTEMRLAFLDDEEDFLPVPLLIGEPLTFSSGVKNEYYFDLYRGESLTVQTTGHSLFSGFIRIRAGAGVGCSLIINRTDVLSAIAIFETGLPAAPPMREFSIPVDTREGGNVGIALVHPSREGETAAGPAAVTARLYNLAFELIGEEALDELPLGSHRAFFVTEIFSDPAVVESLADFRGTLVFISDRELNPVALRQNEPAEAFPQGVPFLTAFPVLEGRLMSAQEALQTFDQENRN